MQQIDISAGLRQQAQRALDVAQEQVRHLITTHPGYFPLYTVDGRWHHREQIWTN